MSQDDIQIEQCLGGFPAQAEALLPFPQGKNWLWVTTGQQICVLILALTRTSPELKVLGLSIIKFGISPLPLSPLLPFSWSAFPRG